MLKNIAFLRMFLIIFMCITFWNFVVYADGASDIGILWDKSGSMFREYGVERMKPGDLDRLNQYVISATMRGTVKVDQSVSHLDKVEHNNIKAPLAMPGSTVTVIDFGVDTTIKHNQVKIRDEAHLLSLLPPINQRQITYFEPWTYYRKAFVKAYDEVFKGTSPHKYLITISDEVESGRDKNSEIENRYNRLERTTNLIFFMVVNNMVNLRIYDLTPPTPTPTNTPTATNTPTPTSTPTFTSLPDTQTPTQTPTPLPITEIQLKNENNQKVSRILLNQKGKGHDTIYTSIRLRWEVPNDIEAFPEKTTCSFADQTPIQVLFEDKGFFRLQLKRTEYYDHKKQKVQVKLPFINQEGSEDFFSLEKELYLKTDPSAILFAILTIIIIIFAVFIVRYLLSSPKALVEIKQLFDESQPIKIVLDHKEREKPIPLGQENQYKLNFDGVNVHFIDMKTNQKKRLFVNQIQTISLDYPYGKTEKHEFRVKLIRWPWSATDK